MPVVGKRVDGPGGRRKEERWQVSLLGSAISLQAIKSVLIEDLSSNGARLVGRDLPRPGREVMIRANGLDLFGQIAWARYNQRGVTFDWPSNPG